MNLENYIARDEQIMLMKREFAKCCEGLMFSVRKPDYLSSIPEKSAVYFIVGVRGGEVLKTYVGKTKNLLRRMNDYHRAFQLNSPNDFKMQALQSWLNANDAGWQLQLHSKSAPKDQITRLETEYINKFHPLVNGQMELENDLKVAAEKSYTSCFHSSFARRAATMP